MGTSIIGLAVALLAAGLSAAASLLIRDLKTRRLEERVRALGAASKNNTPHRGTPAPSIRVIRKRPGRVAGPAARILKLDTAGDHKRIMPWPLALVIAAATGLAVGSHMSGMLGTFPGWGTGFAVGVMTARGIFGLEVARHRTALFKQIPDVMGLILRALRAGLPMSEALRSVSREMASPTREEFGKLVGEISIGQPIEGALWHLYERTQITEYAFFAVTLGLQSQTGGSLTDTLENLADMVRKRVAMANRAKALAAEARMSAGILIALPFVAALALFFIRPGYLDVFFVDPRGQRLLMTSVILLTLGIMTMRWFIRKAVSD